MSVPRVRIFLRGRIKRWRNEKAEMDLKRNMDPWQLYICVKKRMKRNSVVRAVTNARERIFCYVKESSDGDNWRKDSFLWYNTKWSLRVFERPLQNVASRRFDRCSESFLCGLKLCGRRRRGIWKRRVANEKQDGRRRYAQQRDSFIAPKVDEVTWSLRY